MMFSWWKRHRDRWKEGLLTAERATAIIEAEILKQGWEHYQFRSYRLERENGRPLWVCHGRTDSIQGGGMSISVDARTGELVMAGARSYGRPGSR